MAPTRPLVIQHRNSFMRLIKLREADTVLVTGKTPPEYRKAFWESMARVVFSTPQVIRNDVLNNRISLDNYSLIVFDECHRAVKNYAYTDIAKFYVSQARYPLILGMTASPGSDSKRVLDVCRNLFIEHIEYRSEEDPDVKPYIQAIDVEWRRVDLPSEYLEMKAQIRSMLNKRLTWLYNIHLLKYKPEYATRRNLIEIGDELRFELEESVEEERGRIFIAIMNQSLALTLFHMLELLETQGLWTLKAFQNKIERSKKKKRSYAILVNDPEYKRLILLSDTFQIEHPKLRVLEQIVSEQISRNNLSRMIVFTQYRDTASHITSELNNIPGVRAERFVGQASKLMDKGLTQKEQSERIRRLEDGTFNVLVATSIAEEGLDIPAVDHVIFYEPIPSEIRYIQRRGRTGRKSPGKMTILATNDSLDMIYLYASRKRTEKMRKVAENVKINLQSIIRNRPKPIPSPLTPIELKNLDKEIRKLQAEPEIIKPEITTLKNFDRDAKRAAKKLYAKMLQRGKSGSSFDQLALEMECKGLSADTLKGAIGMLVKAGFVTELDSGKYVPTSTIKAIGRIYEVTIDRIYPRSAVATINGKWKARLIPEDYNGPRNLIKKNSKFKASAELYRAEGTLCIRVKEVTEIL